MRPMWSGRLEEFARPPFGELLDRPFPRSACDFHRPEVDADQRHQNNGHGDGDRQQQETDDTPSPSRDGMLDHRGQSPDDTVHVGSLRLTGGARWPSPQHRARLDHAGFHCAHFTYPPATRRTSFCIFIASSTTTRCRSTSTSPGPTSTLTTRPGIGATMFCTAPVALLPLRRAARCAAL